LSSPEYLKKRFFIKITNYCYFVIVAAAVVITAVIMIIMMTVTGVVVVVNTRHIESALRYIMAQKSYPCTSLDRPSGLQEVKAPRIPRQSACEGSKVVRATHRPPLPPGEFIWYSFLLQVQSNPWP
jgi:hypothetical protein